jgi:hypothetical protein
MVAIWLVSELVFAAQFGDANLFHCLHYLPDSSFERQTLPSTVSLMERYSVWRASYQPTPGSRAPSHHTTSSSLLPPFVVVWEA